jgi:primary-amine oxidase
MLAAGIHLRGRASAERLVSAADHGLKAGLAAIAILLPLILAASGSGTDENATHPLDPLTPSEITAAARIVRGSTNFPKNALFSTIVLREPPKQEVLSFSGGAAFRREALAIVFDQDRSKTIEVVVDLSTQSVISWKSIADAQPLVFVDEYDVVPRLVKADARWQQAMRRRGLTNFDKIHVDAWAAGETPHGVSGRLLRALSYYQDGQTNFYGRPIEGVVALVDMTTRQVVELIDTGIVALAPPSQELDEASIGPQRTAPKPLMIVQPQGPTFELRGHEVSWQNWRFRFTMHPREGLVLHTVSYQDGERLRSVIYRASLSEMVVPYGDPQAAWRWRSAFDVGEYGVGRLASPLEPGKDTPENAVFFDAVFADDFGKPYTLPRAIGLYERDGGILWKHFDIFTGRNDSRRARELVMFFVASIGNYDYAISWIFHQDGSLELDAALSGIMLAKGVKEKVISTGGHHGSIDHLVSENIAAPHHQHFFNFRLDLDIDGTGNSIAESNTRALPIGPQNPSGTGFIAEETLLRHERDARRSLNMQSARTWRVFNPAVRNSLGYNCSYVLVPTSNALPYMARTSRLKKRASFIDYHFWATRYDPSEMNAAGAYPNQSRGGNGLIKWTDADKSIENEDLVVWYSVGVTHIPRPEEWPIMSVSHVGFRLMPSGFFNRNPALDVPP